MSNYSLKIIQELENLFFNTDEKLTIQKLRIIKYYLKYLHEYSDTSIESINKIISKIKELPELKTFKPSRIKNIIEAYNCAKDNSGYIQPIGKFLFLKYFLKKYPSPLMIHLSDYKWTIDSLGNFISQKYNCTICSDTIRKELSVHSKNAEFSSLYGHFIDTNIKSTLKKSLPIYFTQLHKNNFPTRKKGGHTLPTHQLSISGFIYGYTQNPDIDITYEREPFFHINHNPQTEFFNLDYLLHIPQTPGLMLLDDTPYAKEVLKKYYTNIFKNKISIPDYKIYLLPKECFDSTPWMRKFDNVAMLFRPILTYDIYPMHQESTLYSCSDILRELKYEPEYEKFFDYLVSAD